MDAEIEIENPENEKKENISVNLTILPLINVVIVLPIYSIFAKNGVESININKSSLAYKQKPPLTIQEGFLLI